MILMIRGYRDWARSYDEPVNVDDLNQLLAYHEVFGKLQGGGVAGVGVGVVEGESTAPPPAKSPESDDSPASPPGAHPCDLCAKVFPYRYQMIVHRRYHTERKPFQCQVCGRSFENSDELSQHGKSCHQENNSMLTCQVCFHVFASAGSLERHARRHCLDKPYQCAVCNKAFGRKEHLENHSRSHSGETPYRCQYCEKSFSRKEHMVNHVRKHTVRKVAKQNSDETSRQLFSRLPPGQTKTVGII
ncbi:hypothetical protein J6590_044017 [Homalodisca vitripennis]|nr:hypothetical protein J6590_044017 [Homalodisca vitripennis]